jgi:hypothetical protein
VQTSFPLSIEPADDDQAEIALRQARLHELMREAQSILAESRLAIAAHHAACEKMAQAVEEVRIRLAAASPASAAPPARGPGQA